MYFKRLEIVGFKSFFTKTILNFEPGITAVVGPNGCGKSNIFDAIRWALGEQSVKSLRGSEMLDVIFNGTDMKEPLGMAEVTLTLDNSKKFFSVDHQEVAITRRIFRSGESEYLLNKTQVRLKDILDLLMGTGIGAESYSLVAQGKIDLILSSKPEDRRLVFDEAAGITKYKVQKKEALRRMEETEQNLLRVNDIITEVKRQIGSLERQASKARRYKETFEELKLHEIRLAILQKKGLGQERDNISAQLVEFEAAENKLKETIRIQESKISNRQLELKTLEDSMLSLKDNILSLDNLASRNNERITSNRERIAELDITKQYLERQVTQARERLKRDEEKLNNLNKEYDGIKKNIDERAQLLKEKEEELADISSSIKQSLDNIAGAKKNILDLVSEIANARNSVADYHSKQQIYLARKKRLDIEKAKVCEEKSQSQDCLKNITTEVERLVKSFDEINLKISNLKTESGIEKASLDQIILDMGGLEKQRLTLFSQKEFLDKLKSKYEDINESMNAVVYLDRLPTEKVNGLVVKIKDRIALTDEDKAYLMPSNFKLSGEAKPIDLDTQEIAEQIRQVEVKISTLQNSKASKEKHIEELSRFILATQDEVRSLEIVLVNKKAQQQAALEQFNKFKEEEDIIILELSDVGNELSVLDAELNKSEPCLTQLETEHKQKEELISYEQNNIALYTSLREKALITITQTKTELDVLTRRITTDAGTLKILDNTFQQDAESLANLQKQLQDANTKQDSLTGEIKDLDAKINEAKDNLAVQKGLLKEAEDKYKEASCEGSDVVQKIELERKELDALKNKLYELQMQAKDIEFKYLSIKERMLQNYKIDLDTIHDIAQPQDAPVQEGLEPLQANTTLDLGQENDVGALMQHIQGLKEKIDSYGTVNLVAIEEYDELKKRYDFLNQQQNDLVTAKESLHEAILKINRTTKKMFLDTFEQVRLEFRNYFKLIFNGGDAQIFLVDEQDPLDSGIEIICRPPGKKLQNVLLLSGGEKSMSAIALIFAIFKVKPSPFCVLDEIDAALDEANVDRFGRILQDFAKDSQFIVITHNKRTIVNADVMYGITMEESGISKIVSVKFGQNKKIQEREPELAQAEPVS